MTAVALALVVLALVLLAVGFGRLVRPGASRPPRLPRSARIPRARRPSPPRPAAPTKRPPRADVPHVLYMVCWEFTDRPCYFGISNEAAGRRGGHERRSWWWKFSDRTMQVVATLPNRTAARAAEREAIIAAVRAGERLTNIQHNPRPVRKEDVRVA